MGKYSGLRGGENGGPEVDVESGHVGECRGGTREAAGALRA